MTEYEIYMIKFGGFMRRRSDNFLGGDPHDGPMQLDFFVWALHDGKRWFVVDTGFDENISKKRDRGITRPVAQGLKALGVEPDSIADVLISHMHYDHAGNNSLFPNARFHVQDAELHYCAGKCMCHSFLRVPYEVEDVQAMTGRLFEGRVKAIDGVAEIAPGLIAHLVGGHSGGHQIFQVMTRRGWVVLAVDAAHYYETIEARRPFPFISNVALALDSFDTIYRLASSPAHVIPGHDPLVLTRYPLARPGLKDIVRVDLDPIA